MMTHDIKLVFKDGKTRTITISSYTSEPKIVQEIGDALAETVAYRSPLTQRKPQHAEKYIPAPPHPSGVLDYSEKTVRVRHVERWPSYKAEMFDRTRERNSRIYEPDKRREAANHRMKSLHWMEKHDEVFPSEREA
jgi:hypothetical protein